MRLYTSTTLSENSTWRQREICRNLYIIIIIMQCFNIIIIVIVLCIIIVPFMLVPSPCIGGEGSFFRGPDHTIITFTSPAGEALWRDEILEQNHRTSWFCAVLAYYTIYTFKQYRQWTRDISWNCAQNGQWVYYTI